ncbi:MAG: enoyl-CoA hydratase/isomerase family protein [Desulfohalobiaceae bacterium]|nr:enoyl-CoA hydratase/isomerase family protein [Desulfohalobiaceae bacterium]
MEHTTIEYHKQDAGTAVITLNRPEVLNAINKDMVSEVTAALEEVHQDVTVRVLVLTGKGKAFCAGGDLSWLQDAGSHLEKRDIVESAGRLISRLNGLSKPVIAAVNGVVAGAGTGVALACDILVASEKARFAPNFVNIGAVPDSGASWFLPRKIGYHRAMELMLTGKLLSAEEAHAFGIYNELVPADDLEAHVLEIAARLAAGPQRALTMIKRMLKLSAENTLQAQLEVETSMQVAAWADPDFQEGVRAFLEGREPRFTIQK